ncbi:MAG: hypothetical protein ACRD3B_01000, partial [Candidatus Sulfotelmatobacter sp.]
EWNGTASFSMNGKPPFTMRGPRAYLQISAETADDSDAIRGANLRPPTGPNDDSFVLENLAPGRYWLKAQTSRGYLASATMGTSDLLREPLVIGAGTNPSIEIVLRDDGAEIEGTITDIAKQAQTDVSGVGSAYQGAWVYCIPLPDSTGQFQQIGVSVEGKFLSQMLAPGSYRILAFTKQQPFLPYRDPEAMKAYESKGQIVNLTAGQKTTVEVQTVPDSSQE